MTPLDLVKLPPLMEITTGRPELAIGLIDGPVNLNHPDLAGAAIREISGSLPGKCALASSSACMHGTYVAGILSARRDSPAPAICPGCTLVLRPIFSESSAPNGNMPNATPEDLAAAIVDCIDEGVRLVNVSASMSPPSTKRERQLEEAINHAAAKGVFVVAAAGNQGALGSTPITRHPWVIPVVACDLQGRLLSQSNLANSIGRRGLSAAGHNITSLGTNGSTLTMNGTSAAAPFVTGTLALLWSEFPEVSPAKLRLILCQDGPGRIRPTIVPPLLNALAAYQLLAHSNVHSLNV